MAEHSETRKVLWGERARNIYRAQAIELEIQGLQGQIDNKRQEAAEYRKRAAGIKDAAEVLGRLDDQSQTAT